MRLLLYSDSVVNSLVNQFAICLGIVCVVPVIPVCINMFLPYVCLCMSEVISPFRSLRAGSQVFAFLMVFLYVILHTM